MPNTKSAIKRTRLTGVRTAINKMNKNRARTLQKGFLTTLAGGNAEETQKALRLAYSAVDKAAKKGVYPKARPIASKAAWPANWLLLLKNPDSPSGRKSSRHNPILFPRLDPVPMGPSLAGIFLFLHFNWTNASRSDENAQPAQ
ncbi:MAG: 30S ribosomal protein S20 [Verrucomicrobia bacterium]|nr:30S ribosomal protein S20 [Verrucomicrobiota bacterium]